MRNALKKDDALDAQHAYEQELLVGASVDLVNALIGESRITQRELAKRLGVTEGRVSQILSGEHNMSLKKLASLAWALGIRFELVPVAIPERAATPAVNDPDPPGWLDSLRTRRYEREGIGAPAVTD
jgi:transcriptional regulator with XRE-family HTH domain